MSWLYNLYQTYENCKHLVGDKNQCYPLIPISHTTKEGVHVCITIDGDGNFKRARVLDKNESRTVMPVTEESAGRTNSPVPHPLADQLQYISKDYKKYGGTKKAFFYGYKKQLKSWCDSPFSTFEINAVYKYISTRDVIADLVNAKILFLDGSGKLLKKWNGDNKNKPPIFLKLQSNQLQSDCFIRWNVEVPGLEESELQWNRNVWDSWRDYYFKTKQSIGLCYAEGKDVLLAKSHPKKILPGEANAKLISSNDTSGYTYRGRFIDSDQACSVGYEVTQKAHNALTWLIRRQGFSSGTLSIVAWAVKGCEIPKPMPDTLSLILEEQPEGANREYAFNAAQNTGKALSKLISGYSAKLGNTDDVIVMALDSMTSGRAAIKYYRQLTGSEYLERIENWHSQCSWFQNFSKEKKFYGAPSPKDIIESAYGRKVDDKLRKAGIERLLPCIADGALIPKDIVNICVSNVGRRQSFEIWEWNKNLGIACAIYRYQNKERNYAMSLEQERKTRDYLYGRLLALAESLERISLSVSNENRPTNAERLMCRFADRPYSTWRNIELALTPHKQRLKASRPGFLNNTELTIIEVKNSFKCDDFCRDDRLSGEYLLGYDCQRAQLSPWKKSE